MLSVTSGQQRWRFDTSAFFLIQLLLFVLYAGTCTATNVNTWVDCGDKGEVFVTNTYKTWVAGEEFCQTLGGHLVSSPQLTTACKAMLVGIPGEEEVHVSYTRLLDKLHFRNVWNNLKVSDNTVTIHQRVDNCSSQYLGENSKPLDERCATLNAIVCGRNTNTQAASIVCDSHMYTYHSISFSADHANQTCYQQYGGRPLSTDGQQLSCASKLLNTSQVLHDNNVSYIPVYTNATNGSHCTTYRPSTNTTHQDSCTAARPTICVSWYCNSIYNLLAVPGEDRCVCRPGYFISTPAHSCESIVDKLNMYVTGEGFGSSNVTVFSLIDSEWRVHRVFTQNTLYLLANLSLPEGKFAIRSAERIIYTFSESLADTVAAELAENRSEFFMVNNSSNNILPTDHLRSYLVNLSVWFRPYKVECVNIPSTNQSDTCSYSVFNESVPFKDGLYEFALSPHNSTLLSIPVLYTVYPRPTTTVPRMTSMPGNNASSSSDGKPSPSSEGSQPSMISSSPSGTDVAPPAKASMVGLYIGVGVAVLLAALVLIVCLMVVVHHNKDGVSLQHQRSGALEAAGERSANNRPTSGTGMRYQSVKHGSSSSVTATNSTQESTAAASSAQPSALHTSQGHNYDNIELTAHPTSTVPSSTGAMATPPGSGNEELSLHRPNRIPDAAVERAADNDYMAPHDLCLANDAGEDDLMTAAATTSMVSTPNTNLAATPKSTTVTAAYKSATTPITDASVSSAGTSATTPVFQSEEEARAASLPAAVAGPVYTEVFLTKKKTQNFCRGSVEE